MSKKQPRPTWAVSGQLAGDQLTVKVNISQQVYRYSFLASLSSETILQEVRARVQPKLHTAQHARFEQQLSSVLREQQRQVTEGPLHAALEQGCSYRQLAAVTPDSIYCDAAPLPGGGCVSGVVIIEGGEFAVYSLPNFHSSKTHEHERQAILAACALRDAHGLSCPVYTDNQTVAAAEQDRHVFFVPRTHPWQRLAHSCASHLRSLMPGT